MAHKTERRFFACSSPLPATEIARNLYFLEQGTSHSNCFTVNIRHQTWTVPGSHLPPLTPNEHKDPRWSQRKVPNSTQGSTQEGYTVGELLSPSHALRGLLSLLWVIAWEPRRLFLLFKPFFTVSSDFRTTLSHNNVRFKVILIESVDFKQPASYFSRKMGLFRNHK